MTIYFVGSVVLGPGRMYSNWSKSTLKSSIYTKMGNRFMPFGTLVLWNFTGERKT